MLLMLHLNKLMQSVNVLMHWNRIKVRTLAWLKQLDKWRSTPLHVLFCVEMTLLAMLCTALPKVTLETMLGFLHTIILKRHKPELRLQLLCTPWMAIFLWFANSVTFISTSSHASRPSSSPTMRISTRTSRMRTTTAVATG